MVSCIACDFECKQSRNYLSSATLSYQKVLLDDQAQISANFSVVSIFKTKLWYELILSYHVSFGNWTEIIRLDCKHLYILSDLDRPRFYFLFLILIEISRIFMKSISLLLILGADMSMPQCTGRGQKTSFENHFLPSILLKQGLSSSFCCSNP